MFTTKVIAPRVLIVSNEEVLRRAGIEKRTTERIHERKLRWTYEKEERWASRVPQRGRGGEGGPGDTGTGRDLIRNDCLDREKWR